MKNEKIRNMHRNIYSEIYLFFYFFFLFYNSLTLYICVILFNERTRGMY